MSNSIIDQANSMVKGEESRMNARASISELERMQQEASFAEQAATERSQRFQAVAQYQSSGAEQEKIQGNNLLMTGNVKVATGFGQIMMGGIMMGMAAIPGAGPAMLAKGLGMIAKGGADVGMGMVDINQGQQALQRAQQKLEEAVKNKVLGKEEAAAANKEMMRSRIMEFKKEVMAQLAEVVKPMLEKAGINSDELTEDQLNKMMDKFFDDAAKSLANGGIMEVDLQGDQKEAKFTDANGEEMEGTFHFIRDEESGKFYKVELAYDDQGNPLKGALGEPLLDTSKGMVELEDGDLKDYLELKFMFVDQLKLLAKELSYTEFDAEGNIKFIPYDMNNIEHMQDFANLVMNTNGEQIAKGAIAAPRKFGVDEKGEYLQEWDWNKDMPIGPKVYMSEIAGETDDMRSNIDNYQIALERSDTALRTLGLQAGGAVFNLLSGRKNTDLASKDVSGGTGFGTLGSRDSSEFQNFQSISTTLDVVRSRDSILEGSSSDDLPLGEA